ncbi:tetratricopeptide repeat protein [Streptomyces sp. NPDC091273]|uniref:tetratricopeptide repeat protein n=1 Tax=Streptomyces sp. NPDC091273 TaxID=3365982 RepID=UPI00380346F1
MVYEERESLTDPQATLETLQDNCASHPADTAARATRGVPIGDLDPLSLKTHPGPVNTASRAAGEPLTGLPGYVPRPHDRALADLVGAALAGESGRLFLVGESSTGRTRACREALRPLAEQGWRLWHPCESSHLDATLADLEQVGPRTVVWLYEAQRHLGAPSGDGERFSAVLRALLHDSARTPVLVLGTLSPANHRKYVIRPREYPQAWDVLAGQTVDVPDAFDAAAMETLMRLAESDTVLAGALGRARNGQVAQYLAGAPVLLERFRNASAPARAVLEAAMDYVRLGVGPHLPTACLAQAAEGYLSEAEREDAPGNWFAEALAEATTPIAPTGADHAPLRVSTPCTADGHAPAMSSGGPFLRLASSLGQHAGITRRALCPPAPFWQAAADHLTDPEHLGTLARASLERHRLSWAERLAQKAAHWGETGALHQLAEAQERAGDDKDAERLFRQAADHDDTWALIRLAWLREEAGDGNDAERHLTRAGDLGDAYALTLLAGMREEAGDPHEAERLARQAADLGDDFALYSLAEIREEAGDHDGAERLVQQAARAGNIHPVYQLALQRAVAGDAHGAERLFMQAADDGDTSAMIGLADIREKAGDHDEAERLAQQAARDGDAEGLCRLASLRRAAADAHGAERLLSQAAEHGNTWALNELAQIREKAGNHDEAERLAQPERGAYRLGELSVTSALVCLAAMRARAGDHHSAERLARHAAHHGDTGALYRLAEIREEAGDRHEAERLALQAAGHGNGLALTHLAGRREEAGEYEEAERLARLAAQHGDAEALYRLAVGRERAGDARGAERLFTESSDWGNTWALSRLAEMRERAGDRQGAERLARRAADRGSSMVSFFRSLWPHGLEADGTPSLPLRFASRARTPE